MVFALYMSGLAAALIIAPNRLITLFGFAESSDVWIRILGYMVGVIAFFYFMAIRERVIPFYRWTVYARVPILPLYVLFVMTNLAAPVVLLFGLIDLLGAIWTWRTLNSE